MEKKIITEAEEVAMLLSVAKVEQEKAKKMLEQVEIMGTGYMDLKNEVNKVFQSMQTEAAQQIKTSIKKIEGEYKKVTVSARNFTLKMTILAIFIIIVISWSSSWYYRSIVNDLKAEVAALELNKKTLIEAAQGIQISTCDGEPCIKIKEASPHYQNGYRILDLLQ